MNNYLRNLFGDESRYVQLFITFLHHSVQNAPPSSKILLEIIDLDSQPIHSSSKKHFLKFCLSITSFRRPDSKTILLDFEENQSETNDLGLAVAAEVIAKMGGSVSLEGMRDMTMFKFCFRSLAEARNMSLSFGYDLDKGYDIDS